MLTLAQGFVYIRRGQAFRDINGWFFSSLIHGRPPQTEIQPAGGRKDQ